MVWHQLALTQSIVRVTCNWHMYQGYKVLILPCMLHSFECVIIHFCFFSLSMQSEYLTDYDCCLGARISSSNSDLLTSKEDKSLAKVETGDQPRDVTLSVDEQYYCKTATKQQVSGEYAIQ